MPFLQKRQAHKSFSTASSTRVYDELPKELVKDLRSMLQEAKNALDNNAADDLKAISNHCIHAATTFQDCDSSKLSVLVYVLSKMLQAQKIKPHLQFAGQTKVSQLFAKARFALQKNKIKDFRSALQKAEDVIQLQEANYAHYVDELLRRGKIKKACKIYDHGISLNRTAEMLDVSPWEVRSFSKNAYADLDGQKQNRQEKKDHIHSISQRFELAKKLFHIQ